MLRAARACNIIKACIRTEPKLACLTLHGRMVVCISAKCLQHNSWRIVNAVPSSEPAVRLADVTRLSRCKDACSSASHESISLRSESSAHAITSNMAKAHDMDRSPWRGSSQDAARSVLCAHRASARPRALHRHHGEPCYVATTCAFLRRSSNRLYLDLDLPHAVVGRPTASLQMACPSVSLRSSAVTS